MRMLLSQQAACAEQTQSLRALAAIHLSQCGKQRRMHRLVHGHLNGQPIRLRLLHSSLYRCCALAYLLC